MATVEGGLVHTWAWCDNCDQTFHTRNAMGLAAQHANRYGHTVRVEKGYIWKVEP